MSYPAAPMPTKGILIWSLFFYGGVIPSLLHYSCFIFLSFSSPPGNENLVLWKKKFPKVIFLPRPFSFIFLGLHLHSSPFAALQGGQ